MLYLIGGGASAVITANTGNTKPIFSFSGVQGVTVSGLELTIAGGADGRFAAFSVNGMRIKSTASIL